MPLQLEIIRATEFIRVGAHGHFDLAASKAALATVASACRKRGIQHAIVDLRAVHPGPKPVFTTADLLELVNTFPEVGFTRRLRLAILYKSDPHKRARLFAFLSTLHGWAVQAFADFEAALHWLSSGQQAVTQSGRVSAQQTSPVRIRQRDTAAAAGAVSPPRPTKPRAGGRSPYGSAAGHTQYVARARREACSRPSRP